MTNANLQSLQALLILVFEQVSVVSRILKAQWLTKEGQRWRVVEHLSADSTPDTHSRLSAIDFGARGFSFPRFNETAESTRACL